MNVVDALSSLSLILSMKGDTCMHSERSLSSLFSNEDITDSTSGITTVIDNMSLNTNTPNNHAKTHRRYRPFHRSSVIVKHGLACMRRHSVQPSTLRTSRYAKLTKETHTKEKQDRLRQQLEEQVRQLECKQDNLLNQVEHLYLYKHHLETQCQETSTDCQPAL